MTCTWDDHFGIMGKWERIGQWTDGERWYADYQCPKCGELETIVLSRRPVEIVPDATREERKRFFKSTVQPWRGGEPSKEFIELYPKQAKQMFTPRERAKAKNVWKGEPGWDTRHKSE